MVGTPRSLELIAMLVLGGEGTLVGPFIGSAVLTLLPTLIQSLASYKTFATGALLVLAVRYLPGGIYSNIFQYIKLSLSNDKAVQSAPSKELQS